MVLVTCLLRWWFLGTRCTFMVAPNRSKFAASLVGTTALIELRLAAAPVFVPPALLVVVVKF